MQLAWIVSCDSYETRADGTTDIYGAGLDTFYVDRLPAAIETIFLARVWLMGDEQGEIELFVLGPDTRPLGSNQYKIDPDPGPNHREGYLVSQTEPIELGFPAEAEGVYSVEFFTDGMDRESVSVADRRSLFFSIRLDE